MEAVDALHPDFGVPRTDSATGSVQPRSTGAAALDAGEGTAFYGHGGTAEAGSNGEASSSFCSAQGVAVGVRLLILVRMTQKSSIKTANKQQ